MSTARRRAHFRGGQLHSSSSFSTDVPILDVTRVVSSRLGDRRELRRHVHPSDHGRDRPPERAHEPQGRRDRQRLHERLVLLGHVGGVSASRRAPSSFLSPRRRCVVLFWASRRRSTRAPRATACSVFPSPLARPPARKAAAHLSSARPALRTRRRDLPAPDGRAAKPFRVVRCVARGAGTLTLRFTRAMR